MEWRDITVTCIAQTTMSYEQGKWLESIGVSQEFINGIEYLTFLSEGPEDRDILTALAAKRCYMSFEPGLNPNITRVRQEWYAYLANILTSGHGSVLEHASATYAIEGLSRVATAELNRHRAGVAISEGSQRYIRYETVPMTRTPFLDGTSAPGIMIREYLERIANFVEAEYTAMVKELNMDSLPFAEKKVLTSLLRRGLPQGTATGGVWTFNLRALRHIIALRSTEHAEEEIAYIAGLLAKDIIERAPGIFQDFAQDADGFWTPENAKI